MRYKQNHFEYYVEEIFYTPRPRIKVFTLNVYFKSEQKFYLPTLNLYRIKAFSFTKYAFEVEFDATKFALSKAFILNIEKLLH